MTKFDYVKQYFNRKKNRSRSSPKEGRAPRRRNGGLRDHRGRPDEIVEELTAKHHWPGTPRRRSASPGLSL